MTPRSDNFRGRSASLGRGSKNDSMLTRLNKELFSGPARYLTYPALILFCVLTIASITGLARPEVFEFLRADSSYVRQQRKTGRKPRVYENLSISKFVKKAVDMHRKEIPPEKIKRFLIEKYAVGKTISTQLEAAGIPVNRGLKYWGRGLSADETVKRLQSEGVNMQRGYDMLKKSGIPVRKLIEDAMRQNVDVDNLRRGTAQTDRGSPLFGGLGK